MNDHASSREERAVDEQQGKNVATSPVCGAQGKSNATRTPVSRLAVSLRASMQCGKWWERSLGIKKNKHTNTQTTTDQDKYIITIN
jgi:hypothetical protein